MTPQVPAYTRSAEVQVSVVVRLTVGASSSLMSLISSISISPRLYAAHEDRQSVQAPTRCPRKDPGIMGPVAREMTGLLAEILPINCAGMVLSQPPIMTPFLKSVAQMILTRASRSHASKGCALTISSVSMAIRFRRYMLVGAVNISCKLIVGKSMASPP